jgi:hypothetical protein
MSGKHENTSGNRGLNGGWHTRVGSCGADGRNLCSFHLLSEVQGQYVFRSIFLHLSEFAFNILCGWSFISLHNFMCGLDLVAAVI